MRGGDGAMAPSGADELFRTYFGYILKIVATTPAIPAQDAEDVAMEIMTRLLERDVLGMFDPGMTFHHDGQEIPARFRTFLTAQVQLYVRGQRDKIGRQRKRELLIVDSPLGDDEDSGGSWADMFTSTEDDLSGIDAAEWIRQARGFLAIVPRRSDQDSCDLVRVFDELVGQVSRNGSVSAAEAALSLGVSPSVMGRWITWMRQNLRQQAVLSRRVTIGGEVYTAAHARQAVAILRGVKGAPFVRQPLARAGSPLATMDYHRIARSEQATYPECRVPALHQGKGHFAPHVLTAVVHHIERVLDPVLPSES